uniref:Uncharacterized protein n=1 Tax=Arundo donax TaxID=35708 RepID=A0A0A9H0L3_ARUDO
MSMLMEAASRHTVLSISLSFSVQKDVLEDREEWVDGGIRSGAVRVHAAQRAAVALLRPQQARRLPHSHRQWLRCRHGGHLRRPLHSLCCRSCHKGERQQY